MENNIGDESTPETVSRDEGIDAFSNFVRIILMIFGVSQYYFISRNLVLCEEKGVLH